MERYAGYPINWAMSVGGGMIQLHPLYIKYNSQPFLSIDPVLVKDDLNGCLATADGAAIVAYLSWLLRTKALLA